MTRWNGDAVCLVGVILVASFVALFSVFAIDSSDAKLLPVAVASVLIALSAIELWRAHLWGKSNSKNGSTNVVPEIADMPAPWTSYLIHYAWVVGFVAALYVVGFLMALPVFLTAYVRWLKASWLASISMAVLLTALFYCAFEYALGLPMYRGFIFA